MGGNETEVGEDFSCCDTPKSLDDQIELLSSLADLISATVENNDLEDSMSIEELCTLMTNKSEVYEEEIEAYDRLVNLMDVSSSSVGLYHLHLCAGSGLDPHTSGVIPYPIRC